MKKVISFLCVICILALTVGGLAAVSSGFQNWNVSTWFGRVPEDKTETQPNVVDENGEAVTNGSAMPRQMIFTSSARSSSSYASTTIIATITPVDADVRSVEWLVEWENASSTWAANKSVSDYIVVAPSDSNALTATVSCLQPFGEPVILTVRVSDFAKNTVDARSKLGFRNRLETITYLRTTAHGTYDVRDNALINNLFVPYVSNTTSASDFYVIINDAKQTASVGTQELTIQKCKVYFYFDTAFCTEYNLTQQFIALGYLGNGVNLDFSGVFLGAYSSFLNTRCVTGRLGFTSYETSTPKSEADLDCSIPILVGLGTQLETVSVNMPSVAF